MRTATGTAGATGVVRAVEVTDVRFPTSVDGHGSDAMNTDPDYSAAYVRLRTDGGSDGFGLAFTIGRGNDLQCAAIEALARHVVDTPVADLMADPGLLYRRLTGDSHFRWLGPEKGVVHMAVGAIVNAGWDLVSRRAGLPLWRYLASMSPQALVDCIDFRYLTDALTPDEALAIFEAAETGKAERIARLDDAGYPAYTTTPGWLGYSDERLVAESHKAVAEGFGLIKLKVGDDVADDRRRLGLARAAVGPDIDIAVDANQRWSVGQAIDWMQELREFDPVWIEEPTSPDDIVGHAAIARGVAPLAVATGEHCHNRVMFKQLLQLDAIDVVQIDAARVGGVNENLAILALAAKFGARVCPHAGGVGLCEMVRHLAFFDYAAVSTSLDGRVLEWVDHLHEHFVDPAVVVDGRYLAPRLPGMSAEMKADSIEAYRFAPSARS
ncbi:MAG: enolase C-terminal domain-like protein [Actinomycetota bacterium]